MKLNILGNFTRITRSSVTMLSDLIIQVIVSKMKDIKTIDII